MTRTKAAITAVAGVLLFLTGGVIVPSSASAAQLTEVTDFGDNPGGLRMHAYVPDGVSEQPAVVVAMHGCGGSGPGFHQQAGFQPLADQHGFVVIYPTATKSTAMGNCFDVWSDASKRRGGGSDPASIVSMVEYAEQRYGADPDRVFVTGSSSGGMETSALLALYPDVFRAGTVFMGVPFTCFANEADFPPTVSKCVNGSMDRTPQEWGDAVRQAYPEHTGDRPRVQLWHGTNDSLVPYQLLAESTDQWTDVFGLDRAPTSSDEPRPGWQRENFTGADGTAYVESISVVGAGHSLPMSGMAAAAVAFFGI